MQNISGHFTHEPCRQNRLYNWWDNHQGNCRKCSHYKTITHNTQKQYIRQQNKTAFISRIMQAEMVGISVGLMVSKQNKKPKTVVRDRKEKDTTMQERTLSSQYLCLSLADSKLQQKR